MTIADTVRSLLLCDGTDVSFIIYMPLVLYSQTMRERRAETQCHTWNVITNCYRPAETVSNRSFPMILSGANARTTILSLGRIDLPW